MLYFLLLEILTFLIRNFLKSALISFIFFLSGLSFTNTHDLQNIRRKGKAISLTPLYHFSPLHRHLGISRLIAAESSPPRITTIRVRTRYLWFAKRKLLATELRSLKNGILKKEVNSCFSCATVIVRI